jgi:dihydroorotase
VLAAADLGARVHLRQTSSGASLETYRRLRDLADVSIETGVQGLMFTAADYTRPWPDGESIAAVANRNGSASASGSRGGWHDRHGGHRPCATSPRRESSLSRTNFAAVPGGFPGLQTLLPALLSLIDEGLIGVFGPGQAQCDTPGRALRPGRPQG